MVIRTSQVVPEMREGEKDSKFSHKDETFYFLISFLSSVSAYQLFPVAPPMNNMVGKENLN